MLSKAAGTSAAPPEKAFGKRDRWTGRAPLGSRRLFARASGFRKAARQLIAVGEKRPTGRVIRLAQFFPNPPPAAFLDGR
jgi:hypothetical protein